MRYEQVGKRWIVQIMDNGAAALIDRQKDVTWGGEVPGWVTMRSGECFTLGAPEKVGRTAEGAAYAVYKIPGYSFRAWLGRNALSLIGFSFVITV